ncbi:MAG: Rne/Rng family ribonuclease [Pseudomonadota bacterium]|nr:Rne/Rng family ribonuclease [Pseudomonadota bacterium]
MTNEILIDAVHQEETRIAIIKDKRLEDYDYEFDAKKPIRGNIYLAKVIRVEPSLQAAFLDYGGNKNAFLPFSEINPDYYQIPQADKEEIKSLDREDKNDENQITSKEEESDQPDDVGGDELEEIESDSKKRKAVKYKIQEVIKKNQVILLQISKEERGNKGAAATTYISIPGRYCVLMPNTLKGGGISRRINNPKERKKLKTILDKLDVSDDMGLIIRTAGSKTTAGEIKKDYKFLIKSWNKVREDTLSANAPSLIFENGSVIHRTLRDMYSKDIDKIYVEGDEKYKITKELMKMMLPSHAKKVQKWRESKPIFQKDNIQDQLSSIYADNVPLRSGGSLVIDQTEALVAIDVNSGTSKKDYNIEDTALRTNLEASVEIARQLKLRDMAGLIVIDFIDMEKFANRRAIEKKLKESLRSDRSRIQVGRISSFGLLEMSRQRIRSSIQENSYEACPHCDGKGSLRTTESIALEILREISDSTNDKRASVVQAEVSLEILNFIVNNKRDELSKLENESGLNFKLIGNNNFRGKECKILAFDSKSNILGKNKNVKEKKTQNKSQKKNNSKTKNTSKQNKQPNKSHKDEERNDISNEKDTKKRNKQKAKEVDKKPSSNKNNKETKKTVTKKTKENQKTQDPRNKNYIGAPVEDSKEIKDKKTGWWNK